MVIIKSYLAIIVISLTILIINNSIVKYVSYEEIIYCQLKAFNNYLKTGISDFQVQIYMKIINNIQIINKEYNLQVNSQKI